MKNERIILRVLPILLIFGFIFCFSSKNVFADGTSLKVSPSVFEIQAKPPADAWAPFTIGNQSDQPVTITVGYKAFNPQASENGNVTFFKNGQQIPLVDKKIFDKIQIVDDNNNSQNSIILGPKQSRTLRIHIILPANEPSSDYYFSLIFLEVATKTKDNKSGQESISQLQPGIAINVLLAVGDKEIPQGSIEKFSTNWFQESGPVPFDLTVFNNGQHFITPHGFILIKNIFGQTVGKVLIPTNVILVGTGRTLSGNLKNLSANQISNLPQDPNKKILPSIVWSEKFLMGTYTATLSLSLSDDGPTYTRSIYFFSFPLSFLLGTIIIIATLFLFYLRVKRKIA
jgi:hypothetical protein